MLNHVDLMAALTADYLNVFVARPKEDSADIIKLTGYVTRGITDVPEGFSYSKLLRTYANDRVHPEDRDYFLQGLLPDALIETFSDGRDCLEYNYRILENGEIHLYSARYNRISKPDEDLKLVVGFRNIDFITDVGREKRNEGLFNAYNAISEVFFSLHRVNVQNNTYVDIKSTPTIDRLSLSDSNDYDTNSVKIINGISSDWSREKALHFVDRRTLPKRMEGKDHISMEFLSYASELCKLHFLREDEDENGNLCHVILAVEKIDDEKNMAVINALSTDFQNVFCIDLRDGSSRTIKMSNLHDKSVYERYAYGFIYEDYLTQYLGTRVHPDDREMLKKDVCLEHLRETFQEKNDLHGSYRILVNGEVHHFRYTYRKIPEINSVVAGFRNIDDIIAQHNLEEQEKREQERKERELEEARFKEQKERYEVILSLSTIYSAIFSAEIDTHHYEILNNVSLMKTVAPNEGNFDDLKEKIINAFMAPEMRERMREFLDLNTLAKRLETLNTILTEYKDPEGRWFQARFIVKRRDDDGKVREVLYVARNMTEEKEKELAQQERLSRALNDAKQANEAKSAFLSSMSHDIRTPMNAIIGFTSLAQTHINDQKLIQDYLTKINTSSAHLLNLINDILDMTRIESGSVKLEEKPVNIPNFMRDLCSMIQGLTNSKGQHLYVNTENVIHENVLTDKLRLNQVLINILGNAVKYTESEGNIFFSLREEPCADESSATYVFSVKDNGPGMSKEFQSHIFETFTREHSSTVSGIQGTGLGMAITKNIVDLMGGKIDVQSEEGKGSLFTVTVTLPLSDAPEKNTAAPKHHDYSGMHVLLVEDNALNSEIAATILEDAGIKVDTASDGSEAIDKMYRADEDEYDLIFMDIQMPKVDGYTATREIRTLPNNKKANIPIIAMTANAFEDDRKKSFEAGMSGYIVKPVNIEDIKKVLDEIIYESKESQ